MFDIELNICDTNINTWIECINNYQTDVRELMLTSNEFENNYNDNDSFFSYILYMNLCYMQDICNNVDNEIRYNFTFPQNFVFEYIKKFNRNYSTIIINIIKKYLPNYYNCVRKNMSFSKNILTIISKFLLKDDRNTLATMLINSKDNKETEEAFKIDYENFVNNYFYKKLLNLNLLRHHFKHIYLSIFLNNFKNIGCLPFNDIKSIELYTINAPYITNYLSIDLLLNTNIIKNIEIFKENITPSYLYTAFLMSCVSYNIDKNIIPIWNRKNSNVRLSQRRNNNQLLSRIFSYLYPSLIYHNSLRNTIFLKVMYYNGKEQLILNLKNRFKVYDINDYLSINNLKELHMSIYKKDDNYDNISNNEVNGNNILFDGNMNKFLIEFIYFYKDLYKEKCNINIENINKFLTIDLYNKTFLFDDEIEYNRLIEKEGGKFFENK